MKQGSLFPMPNLNQLFAPVPGRRKSKRPLSSRRPIHLILKADPGLRRHERGICRLVFRRAEQTGVKVFRMVVSSDHIRCVVKTHSRRAYNSFIRSISGLISKIFRIKWRHRPATRLASWGKDFRGLLDYLKLNEWEALGYLEYQPLRTRALPEWLKL
jgi:REP element-mobilizing transposase RayT